MARQRRRQVTSGDGATASGDELTCPECGKSFTRAASLGAHRQRAHGVAGTSKKTTGSRRTASRRRAPASTPAALSRQARDGQTGLDRDQLLRALFPNGVPPQEAVIRRVGDWLDEAERLKKL